MIRYAILLVLLAGCAEAQNPALREVPIAELAAEIAVRFAAARANTPTPAPEPPPTTRCNKCTDGKVKTGDGLDWTQCECGDNCECESKAPADPPLVPVPKVSRSSGRIECRNGTCYWIDNETGMRYRVVK